MAGWKFEFRGDTLEFDPDRDLTLRTLRDIKGWFPELGTYRRFVNAIGEGDPDAIATMICVARKRAGITNKVNDPTKMEDFALGGDFYLKAEVVVDEPQETDDPAANDPLPDSGESSN